MDISDIIKKVKQIEIRTKRKTNTNLMGQYHSAFKGQGMTFAEIRPYQFGDEIRRIDWNKTARFQEPFVKVMEEERELSVMLLVDISASMNYGTHTALKKEFVAEICASIGLAAVNNNDKIGLILFADKIYKVIPPQKGRKHLLAMISLILSTKYIPKRIDFNKCLEYTINILKKKSILFLFSDFNDETESKNLKIIAQKHELIGIRVFDEKDNEIPNIGYAELSDIETGQKIWVNTTNTRFRYDFREKQRQKIQTTSQLFEKSSASFLNLKTGTDYVKELYKVFKH